MGLSVCPMADNRRKQMSSKTKVPKAIAHAVTTYGFAEVQRRISNDPTKTPEEKFWAQLGALAGQLVTHVAIEAVGNYFDSEE